MSTLTCEMRPVAGYQCCLSALAGSFRRRVNIGGSCVVGCSGRDEDAEGCWVVWLPSDFPDACDGEPVENVFRP